MEILKCNADYNKVYYVEIEGSLCQCKLIRTESSTAVAPVYVLDVAQRGLVRIQADRSNHFNKWYHNSEIPSILYESIEDYRKRKPITDNYGSTSNCYNSNFIKPLFTRCTPCNCGGDTCTWKWNGCKAIRYIVSMNKVSWSWDANGFHCELNELQNCYRTEDECVADNSVEVIIF